MKTEVCEFRWLDVPYRRVRAVVLDNPPALIRPAAAGAVRHSGELLTTLGVEVAGHQVERQVEIALGEPVDLGAPLPIVKLPMRWHSAHHPDLFPVMDGVLEIYPISGDRTQLSMQGRYEPPFGRIGELLDGGLLHRVADGSVERFLDEIADAILRSVTGNNGRAQPPPLAGPGEGDA